MVYKSDENKPQSDNSTDDPSTLLDDATRQAVEKDLKNTIKLEEKDKQIRKLDKNLRWRTFLLSYLFGFGRVEIVKETVPVGFGTGPFYYKRMKIKNLRKGEVEAVRNVIEENDLLVAMNETKTSSGYWHIEIM